MLIYEQIRGKDHKIRIFRNMHANWLSGWTILGESEVCVMSSWYEEIWKILKPFDGSH